MTLLDSLKADYLRLLQLFAILKSKNMPPQNVDTLLPWDNEIGSEANRHNCRVICDLENLLYSQKEVLVACVKQESDFYPLAEHHNTDGTYDYGIAQFNTGVNRHGVPYWIGEGATFASKEDVLTHPQRCIEVMARYYKATGNLNPWVSYSSKAYEKWLGKV